MKPKIDSEIEERLKTVEAVLFDLDGTVVDTIALIRTSFRFAVSRVLGLSLSDEVLLQNLGMPLLDQMKVFSEEKAEELVEVYREHNQARHDQMIKRYADTESVLKKLAEKGYALAIVTSKSSPLAKRGLSVLGLEPYFELVVSMDDTSEHKPLPAPVLAALKKMKRLPENAIYIGDSPHDLKAGRAAGVLTAAALWGPFSKERLLAENPDILLDDITDLLEIL